MEHVKSCWASAKTWWSLSKTGEWWGKHARLDLVSCEWHSVSFKVGTEAPPMTALQQQLQAAGRSCP
eukprot:5934379-Amphidinium_carterae.1